MVYAKSSVKKKRKKKGTNRVNYFLPGQAIVLIHPSNNSLNLFLMSSRLRPDDFSKFG